MTRLFDSARSVATSHPRAKSTKRGYILSRHQQAWEIISELNQNPADEGLVRRLADRSLSGDPTDEFNVGIYRVEAGMKHPLHLHAASAEFYYVLAGRARFTLGDETVICSVGTAMYIPAGMPHAIESTGAHFMELLYSFSNPNIGSIGTEWL